VSLIDLKEDLRTLWNEFETLEPGGRILGCGTKKQFCDWYLHVTPRAIRYLLQDKKRGGEQCSSNGDANTGDTEKTEIFHCTITEQNIEDTRCLSMVSERLDFAQQKAYLLVAALADEKFSARREEIKTTLGVFLSAFQNFKEFATAGTDFLQKHVDFPI